MMTKKTNARVFAVCSLVLLWSLLSVAGARADENQFSDNGDGTIYDAKTGLTWHQDGSDSRNTWQEALAYVDSLNAGSGYGGCRGWVLPTSKELNRLVDHHKSFGSALIDTNYFPNTYGDYYWSSSSHKANLKYATSFGNGHKRKRSSSNRYYVRAVRGMCDPTDNDGDGYTPGGPEPDCNDNDPNINPGAVEVCDGYVDNNCDGDYDLSCWNDDKDGDGQTENEGDCDDRDPNNWTGNLEVCDGADNDCDTVADNGLTSDADADGYTSIGSCEGSADDCNDSDADVNPGAAEICDDLFDQNCDGVDLSCLDVDNDNDSFTENTGDCDDGNAAINPNAVEVCDNVDNDCDDSIDENLTQPTACGVGQCGSTGIETCTAGIWGNNTCTQGAPSAETCDNVDNNCDGSVDENLTRATSCGVGECESTGFETCSMGVWGGDTCVAGTPSAEICDNLDNNCDGSIDDNLTQVISCELPGACVNDTGVLSCIGAGVWDNTCDSLPSATPEICDDIDNDCDGLTDEGVLITFYQDFDLDAFGNPLVTALSCSQPSGYVADNTDCDDTDDNVNPSVAEICGDGTDQDCIGGDQVCITSGVQLQSNGKYFDFVQLAYDDIAVADTIKMLSMDFGESLIFDQNVTVTLMGGYAQFSSGSPTGWSTLPSMVISNGKVIIGYIIFK